MAEDTESSPVFFELLSSYLMATAKRSATIMAPREAGSCADGDRWAPGAAASAIDV